MESSNTEYADAIGGLEQSGVIVCGLIKELLDNADIQILSITHRVKDVKSAVKKLSLRTEKYSSIAELTDLLGVRVITYFPNDVDRVAKVIEKEFKIDKVNSIDKRTLLDIDKFGYLSLHYVASLVPRRSKLIEYKRYSKMRFELQVRSVLQHAWAEIEHDLGYKLEGSLPREMRRSFSRLAGLLELADEEFERLRAEISQYEERIDEVIKSAPQTLSIDQSTVTAALEVEQNLIELDQAVASAAGKALREEVDASYAGSEATELKYLGVNDISELIAYAKAYKEHVAKFAEKWFSRPNAKRNMSPFYRGIGLFYLGYALAAQSNDEALANWGQRIRGRNDNLLDNVRATWQEVVKDIGQPSIKH